MGDNFGSVKIILKLELKMTKKFGKWFGTFYKFIK